MNWESRYLPPDPIPWRGRTDVPPNACFFQHMRLLNLLTDTLKKTAPLTFAILGFKCDEGIQRDLGRTGAVDGPSAIRQRLAKLPLQKTTIHCYDVGNIVCIDHDLEASQAALGQIISMLLTQCIIPIVIGGGHELAFGHYQGIAKMFTPIKRLGIVNFDAHFDLHPLIPNSSGSAATTFYQIASLHQKEKRHLDYNCIGIQHAGNIRQLFDTASKCNTKLILADELHQGLQEKCFDFIDRMIDENDIVYMSLSLNVFSPAFAPGVSSIQPLGLTPWHVIPLIRQMAASAKMISYDIADHVPRYDIDHRTAKLAAILIYEIIHHHCEPAHFR
jgi:formiminoglutamase